MEDLADWTLARGSGNAIRRELLKRRDLKLYLNKKEGETAKFIASLGADAVGISNVFTSAACGVGSGRSDSHMGEIERLNERAGLFRQTALV